MMQQNNHARHGYILLLTLMLLSLCVLVVTQLFYRASAHLYFDDAMNSRQKAQVLAMSAVDLAQSQLSLVLTQTIDPKKDRTLLLQKIAPLLNTWTTVVLKQDTDGIDAELAMMISCEDGKININTLFDFSKKDFKSKEAKSFVQLICARLKPLAHGVDLFPVLEKFLKSRAYPLDDISDVLTVAEFKKEFGSRQFPHHILTKKQEETSISLFDLFTVFGRRSTLSAWGLSSSSMALLGLRAASDRAALAKEVMKKVNVDEAQLKTLWDAALKKWYGKEYKDLPKGTESFISARFEPLFFSVTCSAKVGSITQKLYAIIGREFDEKKGYAELSVKKLYWI